jgi:hypothetical protein
VYESIRDVLFDSRKKIQNCYEVIQIKHTFHKMDFTEAALSTKSYREPKLCHNCAKVAQIKYKFHNMNFCAKNCAKVAQIMHKFHK